jgi:hypothetical protein
MQSHKVEKIYVDMDGVLCNFVKKYRELFNQDPESLRNKKDYNKNFDNFINGQHFASLEMMPDAFFMVDYLRSRSLPIEILSSTGRPENHEEVSRQKIVWLQTHGITFKPNFVPGKELKKKFATPNSIIIDDTLSVIDDWKQAGGIAIHHKNARDTVVMLKFYLLDGT